MTGTSKHGDWLQKVRAEGKIKTAGKRRRQSVVEEPADQEIDGSGCPPDLMWAWRAFCALSRTRLNNQTGPQPILVSEIVAYCDLIGVYDFEDREDILFYLDALDVVYLKEMHKRIQKQLDRMKSGKK